MRSVRWVVLMFGLRVPSVARIMESVREGIGVSSD